MIELLETLCYVSCRTTVLGWLASILHRMEVVQMDKKEFDFKDLMAFGMFILSLLTFIYTICH